MTGFLAQALTQVNAGLNHECEAFAISHTEESSNGHVQHADPSRLDDRDPP